MPIFKQPTNLLLMTDIDRKIVLVCFCGLTPDGMDSTGGNVRVARILAQEGGDSETIIKVTLLG